jgi:tetratricopeptide (TPR) repeat protein
MAGVGMSACATSQKRLRALGLGFLAVLPALVAMAYQRVAVFSKLPPVEFPFLDNPLTAAGFWSAKLTALRLLAKCLGLLIWPAHLSWDYSYAQIPMATGSLADWAGWMAVAAVGAAALLAYRFERTVFFAIGFAFVTFLPTSNLVLPIGTVLAERLLYLPAIALAICLGAAAGALGRRTGYPRMAPVVLGVIGVALAARTWVRNADWRDSVTVTAAGVVTSPNSYKTHGALALALFEAEPGHGNLESVIAEAEEGLAILHGLPDERSNSEAFLQAADYYRARGNLLSPGGADPSRLTAESRQAYQRELHLLLDARSIVEASLRGSTARARARGAPLPQLDAAKFVEMEDALSAAYLRLGDPVHSAAAAAAAIGWAPEKAESYRLLAAALLVDGKAEDAAITLFQGLLATADMDFRSKLETLYQDGLGGQGCALVAGSGGPQINPSCEIVRRHACSAVARLIPVYTRLGRQDLAIQLQRKAEAAFGCR